MSNELQRELAILGQVTNELRKVDARLVAMCDSLQDSYRLCINQSPVYRTHSNIADYFGMSDGALTQILNSDRSGRVRHLGREREEDLQTLCQNTAIDQWAAMRREGTLNKQRTKEDRRAELLRELAQIEATA